jgi:hypothetical protein
LTLDGLILEALRLCAEKQMEVFSPQHVRSTAHIGKVNDGRKAHGTHLAVIGSNAAERDKAV